MPQGKSRRRWPLHTRILAGLICGAALGGMLNGRLGEDSASLHWVANHITEPVGQLFLRLLLLLVVPLVFTSLTLGVAGIGDIRRVGRVGVKCLIYTVVISAISVGIGLAMSNLLRPGQRIDPKVSQRLQERYGKEAQNKVTGAKA